MKKLIVVILFSFMNFISYSEVTSINIKDLTHNSVSKNCTFCKIISREDKSANIIDEDDDVIAFEKKPIRSSIDFLIVPKKHIENVKFLSSSNPENDRIWIKMKEMAIKLSKKLAGSQDFQLHINNGADAKQTVFHLHMHFKSNCKWKSKIEYKK